MMTKRANQRDEQRQVIADCIARESSMSEWERDFIQSVRGYFDNGGFLSEKQEKILNRIWDRVTEKG